MANEDVRLARLRTLRDDLTARMEFCDSDQNYAALGRLLIDVLKQVDEAGGGKTESSADEIAARRAARRRSA